MAYLDDPAVRRADQSFARAAMAAPLLSRDREADLARRWRDAGDEAALHELVRAYARLVVAMAGRFRRYGLPVGDLIQEGNVGLMLAAARFEPERAVRFSSYATWWIRSAMQDFVLRNWSIVRTGTTSAQKALFFKLRRLRQRIEDATGAAITQAGRVRIAQELGVAVADVEIMEVRLGATDQSLNAPISDAGGGDWQDLLADDRPTPEDSTIGRHDGLARSRWLAEAIGELNPRERLIIRRRRLDEAGATLEELGRSLGVSKERVRQLETRALDKLRTAMLRRVERPADLLADA